MRRWGKSLDRYLAAVERAEAACAAMVAELKQAEDLGVVIRKQVRTIGCSAIPIALEDTQMRATHSAGIATQLRKVGGHCHYGVLNRNSCQPVQDWVGHARKYVAAAVQPIIEGER